MPLCPNCGKEIDPDSFFCPYCGEATQRPVVPERPVGPPQYPYPPPGIPFEPERVSAGDVLSSSWGIITQRPILLVPHLISTIVSFVLGIGAALSLLEFLLGFSAEFSLLEIVVFLITFIISTTIGGMYPILTKQVMDRAEVDLGGTASQALGRFFSLLGAAILKTIFTFGILIIGYVLIIGGDIQGLIELMSVGSIVVLIGLIFVLYASCWFYCTIPALILEDRGVLDALSASKAFSQGKKWSIFGIIIVVNLLFFFLSLVDLIPIVGGVLLLLVVLIFTVYESVLSSYLYIRYRGLLVTPPPSVPAYPAPVTPIPETKQICPTCGAEIELGQEYCGWCGSKLP